MPAGIEQPIMVCTTSFANNITRPGFLRTNILSRKLDRPVINLGISANGKLEKERISNTNPKLFVLDCILDLTQQNMSIAALKNNIINAVSIIKIEKTEIPVLLGAYYLDS